MDEPIVDSKIVGGCDKDPVGIRSGIRERGSVHAWPVISQASQIPRIMIAGKEHTGEADARETRSGEKVRCRAAWRAVGSFGEWNRRWREMTVSTRIIAEWPGGLGV